MGKNLDVKLKDVNDNYLYPMAHIDTSGKVISDTYLDKTAGYLKNAKIINGQLIITQGDGEEIKYKGGDSPYKISLSDDFTSLPSDTSTQKGIFPEDYYFITTAYQGSTRVNIDYIKNNQEEIPLTGVVLVYELNGITTRSIEIIESDNIKVVKFKLNELNKIEGKINFSLYKDKILVSSGTYMATLNLKGEPGTFISIECPQIINKFSDGTFHPFSNVAYLYKSSGSNSSKTSTNGYWKLTLLNNEVEEYKYWYNNKWNSELINLPSFTSYVVITDEDINTDCTQIKISTYSNSDYSTSSLMDRESIEIVLDGAQGEPGLNGIGVDNINNLYTVTTTTDVPSGEGVIWYSFDEAKSLFNKTNKYLWTKETINYTDESKKQIKLSIISVWGDTGPQGPQGIPGYSAYITTLYMYKDSYVSSVDKPTSEVTTTEIKVDTWTTTIINSSSTYKYVYSCEQISSYDSDEKLVKITWSNPQLIGAYKDGVDSVEYATFLKLTNGGTQQGIYYGLDEENKQRLYVNATYIKSGTMEADRILGGTLKLGVSGTNPGDLKIYDGKGTEESNLIGSWSTEGIDIYKGNIELTNTFKGPYNKKYYPTDKNPLNNNYLLSSYLLMYTFFPEDYLKSIRELVDDPNLTHEDLIKYYSFTHQDQIVDNDAIVLINYLSAIDKAITEDPSISYTDVKFSKTIIINNTNDNTITINSCPILLNNNNVVKICNDLLYSKISHLGINASSYSINGTSIKSHIIYSSSFISTTNNITCNWDYRLYSNGEAEMWGTVEWKTAATTAWGGLYVTDTKVGPFSYPITFSSVPIEIASNQSNSISGYVSQCDSIVNTTTHSSKYMIVRNDEMGTTTGNKKICIYVKGEI